MRVSRIKFTGFRRLADTATRLDGDLTAFVGFNEAGKTSMLDALAWFTGGGTLPIADRNRTRPPASDDSEVVEVFYELSCSDRELLADIDCEQVPTSLTLSRTVDGNRLYGLKPDPRRPAKPFEGAAARLAAARVTLSSQFEAARDEENEDPNDWAEVVASLLDQPSSAWTAEERAALEQLIAWFEDVPDGRKSPRDPKLAGLLATVADLVSRPAPGGEMWDLLSSRIPGFLLFTDDRKVIQSAYELSPQQRALDPSVVDLLAVADVSVDALWTHLKNDDTSNLETLVERGNERLAALFGASWNQSGVTVRLKVDATRLLILVREIRDGGAVTDIAERSDGLKAFVALVAFLASVAHDVPPVLLIDEAETHLHYDAQADLVGVLLKSLDTTQVLYTTHSPGCLPSDLGTGIRVVARDREHGDASVIKNDFWQGEGPGFSPLLFAMGAGAAAFSMCRKAVLGEGPSEMILLPTLIRMAVGLDDLDYQVAQGLANAHSSGIRVSEVAAKVVYLVDGDKGGVDHKKQLGDAGVDPKRIFALPEGQAVEDLIRPDDYRTAVNAFLDRIGRTQGRFAASDVVTGQPISKSLTDWARDSKIQIPSKIEVAYALLRREDGQLPFSLTRDGKRALVALHKKFEAAFAVDPAPYV